MDQLFSRKYAAALAVVAVLLSFIVAPSASAQTAYDVAGQQSAGESSYFPYRNQLSISYSDGYALPIGCVMAEALANGIAVAIAAPFIAMFGGELDDIDISPKDFKTYGIADIGYRYVLPRDRFSVGFNVSYSLLQRKWDEKTDNGDGTETVALYKTDGHLLFVTTGATCYYKRRGWCKLYGALDLGIIYSPKLNEVLPIYDHKIGFAVNVTPIGVQMGSDRVAGFIEMNWGYKGFASAGIRISM